RGGSPRVLRAVSRAKASPTLPRLSGPSSARLMRLPSLLSVAAALAFCGCTSASHSAPSEPAGMVSAADPRAEAAGVTILREGGSAADAAFATLLALNVVE